MDTLQVDQPHEGVTRITLDRPERLNAMNATLIAELHEALADIAVDRACRVVVLTGAGRGFCAGIDLAGYGDAPGSEDLDRVGATFATQTHIAALVPRLRSLPQPVIAAVNGPAAGGGLALALASDIRIASATARFNVAFVRLGLSGCDIGVSWLLPRLIGASRAWELMLTGRIIDAEEADRIGLVLRVVPDDELQGAALETAGLIAANAPWGVRMTKEVMWSQLEVGSLQAGIDLENRTQVLSSMTNDMQEAVAAFLQKRPPHYGSPRRPESLIRRSRTCSRDGGRRDYVVSSDAASSRARRARRRDGCAGGRARCVALALLLAGCSTGGQAERWPRRSGPLGVPRPGLSRHLRSGRRRHARARACASRWTPSTPPGQRRACGPWSCPPTSPG